MSSLQSPSHWSVGRSHKIKAAVTFFSSFSFYASFLNDDDDDGSLRKFGNRCARALFLCPFWARWRGGNIHKPPIYLLAFGPKNTNYSTPWACSFSMFSISFMMGASLMGKVGNTLASMSSYIC